MSRRPAAPASPVKGLPPPPPPAALVERTKRARRLLAQTRVTLQQCAQLRKDIRTRRALGEY